MNELAIGILSALVATNSPVAARLLAPTGAEAEKVAAAYRKVLEADEEALAEVNRWMADNERFRAAGGGLSREELSQKISIRLAKVVDAYEAFVKEHPRHVEGRIAYGSFLNEISEEHKAAEQWERARLLDPSHPAPWNNLANHFGHNGPVTNSFPYYARAIELNPTEPVYYQNLATTVYLFRRDAEAYYGFNEQQVFDRALELYRKALELTPGSFEVANDLAQTYYGITPFRQEDAMSAWRDALELATTEAERQGVYIHFARLEIRVGHFSSASNHLNRVTIPEYKELKNRLFRLIESKQSPKPDAGPDPAAEPSQP